VHCATHSCVNNYANAGILTFVVESGLYQFVDFATRGFNLLDFVFYLFKHFVAYSTSGICIQKDTKDMLQAIKGWYSATTYVPLRN